MKMKTQQNLWNVPKVVLRGKVIAINFKLKKNKENLI